ncbi:hypothetical protein Q5Y75_06665 [Ruegeria sp. 2205SS24-7]|uniref:hypothetical protein n=1 Tax=Ruegeria discodermiae TaxID=3064389 RepID=UPI002741F4F2|nr:hypothetical protein [Ruegeria sp. 2205SS24-7]MDP5216894.1 hypothetical protein [Ruegeria sp. 2205SS24-7]
MKKVYCWAYAIGIALSLNSAAQASEAYVGCGQTELLHSNTSIKFVGAKETEDEVGDRRELYWHLKSLDGDFAGTFDVISTIIGGDTKTGHDVRVDGLLRLPNGNIFLLGRTSLEDATDTERSGNAAQQVDLTVTGGTEEFADASGGVTITVPESDKNHLENRPMTINLSC